MRISSKTGGSLQALLVFTRLFAELTHHGVSLFHCSQILAEDAPAPYDDFARLLRERLEANKTLTQCMSESPKLFPPFYLTMIHASEIGGIIDEFLGYLAELLAEQLEMEPIVPAGEGPLHLGDGPENWSALSEPQRLLTLTIWCRSLSLLLVARVPRRLALETVADLLPASERFALRRIAGEIQGQELAGCLQKAGFLPATALAVITNSDAGGVLDLALERLARLYHDILRSSPVFHSARPQRTSRADDQPWGNAVRDNYIEIIQQTHTMQDATRPVPVVIGNREQAEMHANEIPLGAILLRQKKITQTQLKQALTLQKSTTAKLGRLLIDLGFVSEHDILEAYAQQMDIPIYQTGSMAPDPSVAKVIPDHLIKRYSLIPLQRNGNKLVVAMSDPTNVFALDDLRLITGFEIVPVLATEEEIAAIRAGTRKTNDIDSMLEAIRRPESSGENNVNADESVRISEDAPIIRMVNVIIENAINHAATEIQLNSNERQVSVHYRIEGDLHEVMTLPKFAHLPLVQRLKMMSQIPLDDAPQQPGHIYIRHEHEDYDAIVEIAPGEFGDEILVMISKRSDLECGG